MKKEVYLDNNATTRMAHEVCEAMLPCLKEIYGNPSSVHALGRLSVSRLEEARGQVAQLLDCGSKEIYFTSSASESNNWAIGGVLSTAKKKHVITSRVEHPSVQGPISFWEKQGFRVTRLGVSDEGLLDLNELEKILSSQTALVSLMYANNETGVLFPIEEIGDLVKKSGAIFHVDAVQAVGKIPLSLKDSSIDLLSFSGHKFHGPKGIGGLFLRQDTRLSPMIRGGHQEFGRRAGTEALPQIVGLGAAASLAQKRMFRYAEVGKLRDDFERRVLREIPQSLRVGHEKSRLATTTHLSFANIEGAVLLHSLSKNGIYVSSGAACSSGSLDPSPTLLAMGLDPDYLRGALRFSLSLETNKEDMQYAKNHLLALVKKFRLLGNIC